MAAVAVYLFPIHFLFYSFLFFSDSSGSRFFLLRTVYCTLIRSSILLIHRFVCFVVLIVAVSVVVSFCFLRRRSGASRNQTNRCYGCCWLLLLMWMQMLMLMLMPADVDAASSLSFLFVVSLPPYLLLACLVGIISPPFTFTFGSESGRYHCSFVVFLEFGYILIL